MQTPQENKLPPPRNWFLSFVQRHNHIMTWLSFYIAMLLITSRHAGWPGALVSSTATFIPTLLLWALLYYVLLPRLMPRSPVAYYLDCVLMIVVFTYLASHFDILTFKTLVKYGFVDLSENFTFQGEYLLGRMLVHTKYFFILLSTAAVTTIVHLIEQHKKQAEQYREQQMQEKLKYLRAQINPHFLFNALNCIYALTVTQDEQAPDSVLKLSEMLRYVIDDCRGEKVLLTKEVNYIQNYIDFQRIRMEREPNLTFDVQVADPHYQIPPMILQPIIENCFKHSRLIDDPKAWIHITLRQNDSGLLFTADNSKPPATLFSRRSAIQGREDEERTGIGLINVQERLKVLFGDTCSLKVIEDATHYKTILHI